MQKTIQKTKLDTDCDAYRNFMRGISSSATRESYGLYMTRFMACHRLTDFDELRKAEPAQIEKWMIGFIDWLHEKGIKGSSVRTYLAGVERFFRRNRRLWDKDFVRDAITKDTEKKGGNAAITVEQIRKLLSCAPNLRTKALVLFLASTGIRPGALRDPAPGLQQKHLEKMSDGQCYSVLVYAGSVEEYYAFLTPEASRAYDAYLEWRRQRGETIGPESAVFANKMHTQNQFISEESVRVIITNLMRKAGVGRNKRGERYDGAVIYQFRKYFATQAKLSPAKDNLVEKMLGHKRGLDGVYLQPTREECYAEFVKAVDALTIDPTQRQAAKIKELEKAKARDNIDIIRRLDQQQKGLDAMRDAIKGGTVDARMGVDTTLLGDNQYDNDIMRWIKSNRADLIRELGIPELLAENKLLRAELAKLA